MFASPPSMNLSHDDFELTIVHKTQISDNYAHDYEPSIDYFKPI
ncbi:hypothetical protein Lser_V15G05475 [Lactuca serriola]